MEIIRQYNKADGQAGFEVAIVGHTSITVRRGINVFGGGEVEPPTINWPAFGSVSVKTAEAFRDALTLAIEEAKKLA